MDSGFRMRFQEGDTVKIKKSSYHYGTDRYNPNGIEGTVTRNDVISTTGYHIDVDWENGEENQYREADLGLVRRG